VFVYSSHRFSQGVVVAFNLTFYFSRLKSNPT